MSNIRYSEYRKKQRGRYVWGVLQMEGRKQKFQTVGEGEGARRKAKKLAQRLNQMEDAPARRPSMAGDRAGTAGPAGPAMGIKPFATWSMSPR